MNNAKRFLATLSASLFALTNPAIAQSQEPTVGDVLRVAWDAKFKGWTQEQSGTASNQGYVVFSDKGRYIIAITRIVESKSTGVEIHEILQTSSTIVNSGEQQVDGMYCGFIDKDPVLAFKNTKTGIIRGYFIGYKEVIVKRWLIDKRQPCIYGGD